MMNRGIHPWRRLRALGDQVELLWHDGGLMGETDFDDGTISIRRGMTQAERRSTCMHEVLHVERGPVPMGLVDREEYRVRKESARLLLPNIKVVGEAIAWAYDLDEAAEELWVDVGTLRVRLDHLHPAERAYLKRRLEELE